MIDQTLSHYRVLEQIGAGGMGVVYRAHDWELDRDVAIKVLPPGTLSDDAARKQFRKEAQSLARLNHPNIAIVHDFGSHDGTDFLVTEYIPGITLDVKLVSGPLPIDEIVQLGAQLADGIRAAHEQGIVHCDLKPANLRLTNKGQLKILDFGLAQLRPVLTTEALTVSVDRQGAKGTLPYMAPEQLAGKRADPRCDIWGIGAVLYEMSTGKRPFPGENPVETIQAILHEDPRHPRELNPAISEDLQSVIVKALQKNMDQRYQSAAELQADLVRLATGVTPVAFTDAVTSRADIHAKGIRRIMAAGLLLLVVIAAVAYAFWSRTAHGGEQERVLAVLPFDSLSEDPDTRALGNGVSETLASRLSQMGSALQLVSTHEIRAQHVSNAEQARREFGVDLVLEGSLQRAGDLVRINCSLVDPRTHRQLRGRTITAASSDIFTLEDQLVSEIVDLLNLKAPVEADVVQARTTSQPGAYELYLRGRGYLQEYQKPENIDSAIREFTDAVKVDPRYAVAYAGLGDAYWLGYKQQNRGNEWADKAKTECEKAVSLASNAPEGHICLANVLNGTGRPQQAIQQLQNALSLAPNNPDALDVLGDAYDSAGDPAKAEATYKKEIDLRPNYWGGYSSLGFFYYKHARYSDAARLFTKVTELAPENVRGFSNLGAMYLALGRFPDAIDTIKKSIALHPSTGAYSDLGTAYFYSHRYEDAIAIYREGLKLDPQDRTLWGNLGDALYWTPGKRKDAAAPYRKAIDLGEASLKINPQDGYVLAFVASYYAMIGDKLSSMKDIEKAVKLAPDDPDAAFRAALVYNHFGHIDRTMEWLTKAVHQNFSLAFIRETPDFAGLRSDSRFREIVRQ